MELIKTSNRAILKDNFIKALATTEKPVKLHITSTGNLYTSKQYRNKQNFYINFEVLDNLDCEVATELDPSTNKPILTPTGDYNTTNKNIKGEIVGIPYGLTPNNDGNGYTITNKMNLYPIVNTCLISKGEVPKGNTYGFNSISFEEITEALQGVTFYAKSVLVTDTQYKPYYKLVAELEAE